jgi:hypothetical protein
MASGRRMEIVRSVGRSFGRLAAEAFDQSMYSVESSLLGIAPHQVSQPAAG